MLPTRTQQVFLNGSIILAIVSCAILRLLLGLTTWRMATVTHSVINIGLTLALLVGIVFSFTIVGTLSGFTGQHGAYGQMVKDDYVRTTANDQTNPNRILDAERLSTDQSNQAFGNFAQAVDALNKANRDHYTITYTSTFGMLQLYVILCTFLFPAVGLVAGWGVWRRLKEF